ncbi:3-deoxy-D-arabino-heptulosonate 7-phosphate synthase [Bordetella muralis]|uniref:3-deoxy-D-arabino-heptulosonate 7-phosphate synthase n=1 Tax=Bordetella muralis TaxID=1649130 RepID=UPI0039F0A58D
MPAASSRTQSENPSTALAIVLEQVRVLLEAGDTPDDALKRRFFDALDRLIREAVQPTRGDTAFQAMVLRHQTAAVREYASLAAHANQDRREVHAAVNTVAHPTKLQRMPTGALRAALTQLQAFAAAEDWHALCVCAEQVLPLAQAEADSAVTRGMDRLSGSPALGRLRRLSVLVSDPLVQRYRSLWDQQGPRAGSAVAMEQGAASQQRGAAVEARAAQALEVLAQRLNAQAENKIPYRVVTSMRASPSLPGNADYAKSEWDAVLLQQTPSDGDTPTFDVCLLIEAKASVDAATTDLPRLLRGLRLLASAQAETTYAFDTHQGRVQLRGSSLKRFAAEDTHVAGSVLYCCDAVADAYPKLLSTATRMQLLSAPGSVAYASSLAGAAPGDRQSLASVWEQLLTSARWDTVRRQYPLLRQVRDLMVHVDDLFMAVNGQSGSDAA